MIRVIYAILAIIIKDLELRLHNSNLALGKRVIWFVPLTQKKETDNETADVLY